MSKTFRLVLLAIIILVLLFLPATIQASTVDPAPAYASPYDLIAAVNAVRASYGLPAYTTNSILMSTSQYFSDYLASVGYVFTDSDVDHLDSLGRRPFQRALDAGYSVAGDLSLGGFLSENLFKGSSINSAILWWMDSPPHRATILSPTLQDIGAGITSSGSMFYFVIDCGLSTGSSSSSSDSSSGSSGSQTTQTWIPSTPNPDGSIIHIVQPGDTTLAIAIAYGINWSDLLKINNLTDKSIIFPGQQIIIRPANTPTPTQPSATPTHMPTITPWPTSEFTQEIILSPTPTRPSKVPIPAAGTAIGGIVLAALLLAALFSFVGRKHPE